MTSARGWRERVALHRHDIDAAGRRWLIDAVRDQNALLAAAGHFDAFPYGLLLWESAPVLADCLLELRPLTGRHVLEIGAGTGLGGLAAHHLGAEVVQIDHAADALDLARANAALNAIDGIEQIVADWEDWTPPHRFDVIVGADILYDQEAHAAITRLIVECIAPGGVVLLTDPGRTARPAFVADMAGAGWTISETSRQVAAFHPTRPGETVAITIVTLRR